MFYGTLNKRLYSFPFAGSPEDLSYLTPHQRRKLPKKPEVPDKPLSVLSQTPTLHCLTPRGILAKKETSLPALSIPLLWNKGHERESHETHPCSPMSVTELILGWARSVSDVTLPTAGSLQSKGLIGRAQNSSLRVGSGTKETNYLMKDSRSLIHRMWALPA